MLNHVVFLLLLTLGTHASCLGRLHLTQRQNGQDLSKTSSFTTEDPLTSTTLRFCHQKARRQAPFFLNTTSTTTFETSATTSTVTTSQSPESTSEAETHKTLLLSTPSELKSLTDVITSAHSSTTSRPTPLPSSSSSNNIGSSNASGRTPTTTTSQPESLRSSSLSSEITSSDSASSSELSTSKRPIRITASGSTMSITSTPLITDNSSSTATTRKVDTRLETSLGASVSIGISTPSSQVPDSSSVPVERPPSSSTSISTTTGRIDSSESKGVSTTPTTIISSTIKSTSSDQGQTADSSATTVDSDLSSTLPESTGVTVVDPSGTSTVQPTSSASKVDTDSSVLVSPASTLTPTKQALSQESLQPIPPSSLTDPVIAMTASFIPLTSVSAAPALSSPPSSVIIPLFTSAITASSKAGTASAPLPTSSTQTAPAQHSSALSAGARAGIGTGITALCLAILGVSVYLFRNHAPAHWRNKLLPCICFGRRSKREQKEILESPAFLPRPTFPATTEQSSHSTSTIIPTLLSPFINQQSQTYTAIHEAPSTQPADPNSNFHFSFHFASPQALSRLALPSTTRSNSPNSSQYSRPSSSETAPQPSLTRESSVSDRLKVPLNRLWLGIDWGALPGGPSRSNSQQSRDGAGH